MFSLTPIKFPIQNSEYDQEYHNYKLQSNPWHRDKEPHNNQETPGRQTKQSSQLKAHLP